MNVLGESPLAALVAVEKQRQMLIVETLLPKDSVLSAQALANDFGVQQMDAYIKLLASGMHYETAFRAISKCPSSRLDLMVEALSLQG